MKNRARVILLLLVIFTFVVASLNVCFAKEKAQENCPVMGNPIDKKVYADYKGKRVYFCCKMCIEAFEKDPDKYLKKFQEDGVVLEKAPKSG